MSYTKARLVELITNPSKSIDPFVFDCGEVGRTDEVEFSFEFLGDNKEDLLGVKPGCGCTSVAVEDGVIKGKVRIASAVSASDTSFNKSLLALFKRGGKNDEPEFYIIPETKVATNNKNAPFLLSLRVIGKVRD